MAHRVNTPKLGQWIYHLLRIVLGGIFIWASWEKIVDPAGFINIIDNYRIIPQGWSGPLALLLPWVEVVCGVLLIAGYLLRGTLVVANGLLLVFLGALVSSYLRGIDVSCGCFSNALTSDYTLVFYILRDVLFLAMGVWVLYFRLKIERALAGSHNP